MQPQAHSVKPELFDFDKNTHRHEEEANARLINNHKRSGSTESALDIFIDASPFSPRYGRDRRVLGAQCPAWVLASLPKLPELHDDPLVAYIDDRGSKLPATARSYRGPVTLPKLWRALQSKVQNSEQMAARPYLVTGACR